MLTILLICAGIGLIALLSYLSSAKQRDGRSSQTDSLPPHYEHLLRQRRQPLRPTDTEAKQASREEPAEVAR